MWLKHGRMLDLSITCDGSGPWEYCWVVKPNYTVPNNVTCDEVPGAYKTILSGICSFNVSRYLSRNGEYSLILIVDDGLKHIVKQVGINVFNGPR